MLSDRSYPRSDYPAPPTSVLTWIASATLAASSMSIVLESGWFNSQVMDRLLGVSGYSVLSWKVWTVASYVLVHDSAVHLLLVGLGLYVTGREVAPLLGGSRFAAFYAGAAVAGAAGWLACNFTASVPLVGAAPCVMAMLVFLSCVYPEREMTVRLFLVLPISLRPKTLAWGLFALSAVGALVSEIPAIGFETGFAHVAHLGGMAFGWLYFRVFHANAGLDRAAEPVLQIPQWVRRSATAETARPNTKPVAHAPISELQLKGEVDRILDKINSEGFGALTEDEKRLLDEAKELLSRR